MPPAQPASLVPRSAARPIHGPSAQPPPPSPTPGRAVTSVPLLELRDGLPPLVATPAGLADTLAAFAAGTGPVAVDAERASGYRYSSRAYLVQLRRAGVGTAIIDPIPLGALSELGATLTGCEWVLHAASQDLPSLAAIGLRPARLFDTELAGRLLNYPKVGLAAMVEQLLGYRMRKEHSAVDWSRRPLPKSWLRYAALDVEMLLELRDVLARQLLAEGKQHWAEEEFAALAAWTPGELRQEPWRRTSGLHRVRGRRGLAVVRELWDTRDAIARERDIAAGRILNDAALCEIAIAAEKSRAALAASAALESAGGQRHRSSWLAAVRRAQQLPEVDLPQLSPRYDGPPPARVWAERDPAAAARLTACREAMRALAEQHRMPVENILAPDAVRRLAWQPPEKHSAGAVAAILRSFGARDWQVTLTAQHLADALAS